MPNGNEDLFEGEIKETRLKIPEKLLDTVRAMANQLSANADCTVNRHKLICYILAGYLSEYWKGKVPYEEKKEILEFAESEGGKL